MDGLVLDKVFCEEVTFEIQKTKRNPLKYRGKCLSSMGVACVNVLWQELDIFKKGNNAGGLSGAERGKGTTQWGLDVWHLLCLSILFSFYST